jgi:DNA-binding NtrC family response regulator
MLAGPSRMTDTILLIDDDEYIAGSLRRYLATESWAVDVALDASSAYGLMKGHEYGVVMVDPYLTGAVHREDGALLRSICTMQPSASLIVLTAYGSPELAELAQTCRVVALLRKPQSVVALGQIISAAVKSRGEQSAHV